MSRYVPTITESMKMITTSLLHSMEMADIFFGTVTKESPLEITIDQQHILTEDFLVLTNMVKDHPVDLTVSFQTENDAFMKPEHTHTGNLGGPTDNGTLDTTHKHEVKHKIKVIQHYGLTIGEKVILLRMQGGQSYLVLDRVDDPPTNGEFL